jgi:hypothetical protein
MARQLYFVDWSDSSYPEIKAAKPGDEGWTTLQTFTACKEEIIQSYQYTLEHAQYIIRRTRALRVGDV